MAPNDPETRDLIQNSNSTELASNRTALAFERTRMAADRTLMAIVRTSLSLISFGFTIYEVFNQLQKANVIAESSHTPRNIGLALILLGVLLLIMGIVSHMHFGKALNQRRDGLYAKSLLHNEISYSATPTFVIAFLLLIVGTLTAMMIVARMVL